MRRSVIASVLLLLAACSTDPGPNVLARVGDADIDIMTLQRFVAGLPAWTRGDNTGEAQVRDYLQSLIDRELLLAEARARGLEEDPAIAERVQSAFDDRLGRQLRARSVEAHIEVTDEEVAAAYEARNWNRSLRVSHIFVRTDSLLALVLSELAAGRSFEAVARKHSEDPPSAARGGVMPNYYTRATATATVRDALFALPVGTVSAPVRIDKGYEIFFVLDELPVSFANVSDKVRDELKAEKLAVALDRYIDSLATVYGSSSVASPAEAGRLLARQARDQGFHQTPGNRSWYTASQQELLIRELRRQEVTSKVTVTEAQIRASYDENRERYRTADEVVLAEVLLKNRDEAEDVLAEVRHLRARAAHLLQWARNVRTEIDAGRDPIKQIEDLPVAKDEDIATFVAWLDERLSTPSGRADFVSELIDSATPGDLLEHYLIRMHAMSRSQRPGSYEAQGHYHIRYYDPGPFAPLVLAAMEAGAGRFIGPIELPEGFSVAKVLVAEPRQDVPLEEVVGQIRRSLAEHQGNEDFHEFLLQLRSRTTEDVIWFDDNIRRAAAELDLDAK